VEVLEAGADADRRVVRVVIVEDHAMVAQALAAVLGEEDDIEVVAVEATAADGLSAVERSAPDVVLVDFRLPDGDGADVAAAVRRLRPEARVIVLTAAEAPGVVGRVIAAGADGFLHKSEPITEVVRAIRAVGDGGAWFPRDALADLVGGARGDPSTAPVGSDLTPRERDVLELLAAGSSTQAMIDQLVLSPHTVRNHVRNVMAKLGAHSKLEAVTIAARAGLVRLGDRG
jgi:DNA-binding NarL/FixJ family response regulator